MTAEPPTSTRSIFSAEPVTRACSVLGRRISAPCEMTISSRTGSARAGRGGKRAGRRPSPWPDPRGLHPRERTSGSSSGRLRPRSSSSRRSPAGASTPGGPVRAPRRPRRSGAQRRRGERRCRIASMGSSELSTPTAARSSTASANGSTVGTGWLIQPKLIRSSSRSSRTGMGPLPVSSTISGSWSGEASTNAVRDGMAGERQLVHRREDADPGVAALLGRIDVDGFREGSARGRAAAGFPRGALARQ